MEIASTTAASARDEFLQLLVTQLRNQDPLDPVKQEDFLSQLAQFSTLEGVEKLNSSLSSQLAIQNDILKLQQFSQAATMVGRFVTFASADGTVDNGVVDSITVNQDGMRLRIGNQTIGFDSIIEVAAHDDLAIAAQETQAVPPSPFNSDSIHKETPILDELLHEAVEPLGNLAVGEAVEARVVPSHFRPNAAS